MSRGRGKITQMKRWGFPAIRRVQKMNSTSLRLAILAYATVGMTRRGGAAAAHENPKLRNKFFRAANPWPMPPSAESAAINSPVQSAGL
ncbi:hypothetical protein DDZ15_16270 [Rhodohalobacter mucosus]|uniref:Uncharacterized protein n=1 Tax=Rhodohalobacter mucosus TaxID=2079485 RepID=A0A316TPH0_9BACT|nr:hypothetical protein DDZ15_16270 [Rhodohalobacter mucosus]